ncbi:hypothetical protein HYU40_00445 [Candidatus Woesearchaeota archaeon]|nr:hypothetical protein [Candidatus Woesearchaeota archaeon]
MSPVFASKAAAAATENPKFSSFFKKENSHVNAYASVLARQAAEFVKNFRKSLTPKTIFIMLAVLLVMLLFGRHVKDILLVGALGFAASYSTIYKRTFRFPSAVELVTFGTVITGAAYGPLVGALFGVITTVASEIISSGVDVNTMFYAISRGISGGVAQLLIVNFGVGVVVTGMIALVIFHVVSDAIYLTAGGIEAVPKIIYFVIVNTLFNLLVFAFLGGPLLSLARL